MSTQKNKERFEKWFVKPLRELEAIPDGDGAFIALATSCFLYERYVRTKFATEPGKSLGDRLEINYRNLQLASDLSTDETTAAAFWKVMRNGLLHLGMPQRPKGTKERPKWRFDHSYPRPVVLSQHINGEWWLEVQPWKFMDVVIKICQSNIDLIIGSEGFPWATIEEEDEE